MDQQTLYELSCREARKLLDGLETGNFEWAEQKLAAIRHYITLAERIPAESLRGKALHHREQMELLSGLTETLAGALSGIQERIRAEMESLDSKKNLLRHLVSTASPVPQSRAAGYTLPAAPIG